MDLFEGWALLTPVVALLGIILIIPVSIRLFQRFVGLKNHSTPTQAISLKHSFWIDNGRRLLSIHWKNQEILLLLSPKGDQVIAIDAKKDEDNVNSIKRAEKTA